jgi:hypothetical protein
MHWLAGCIGGGPLPPSIPHPACRWLGTHLCHQIPRQHLRRSRRRRRRVAGTAAGGLLLVVRPCSSRCRQRRQRRRQVPSQPRLQRCPPRLGQRRKRCQLLPQPKRGRYRHLLGPLSPASCRWLDQPTELLLRRRRRLPPPSLRLCRCDGLCHLFTLCCTPLKPATVQGIPFHALVVRAGAAPDDIYGWVKDPRQAYSMRVAVYGMYRTCAAWHAAPQENFASATSSASASLRTHDLHPSHSPSSISCFSPYGGHRRKPLLSAAVRGRCDTAAGLAPAGRRSAAHKRAVQPGALTPAPSGPHHFFPFAFIPAACFSRQYAPPPRRRRAGRRPRRPPARRPLACLCVLHCCLVRLVRATLLAAKNRRARAAVRGGGCRPRNRIYE